MPILVVIVAVMVALGVLALIFFAALARNRRRPIEIMPADPGSGTELLSNPGIWTAGASAADSSTFSFGGGESGGGGADGGWGGADGGGGGDGGGGD